MREAPQLDFPLVQQFHPRARGHRVATRTRHGRAQPHWELPALTVPGKGEGRGQ